MKKSESYEHLRYEERLLIRHLWKKKRGVREIARELGRSASTISREVRRNEQFAGTGYYYAHFAQMKANGRRRRSYGKPRLRTKAMQKHVEQKLKLGWSPGQISGRLRMEKAGEKVSHEAIYQWIYRERRDLRKYLCWGRKRRMKRGHSRRHRKPHIPGRVSITERPKGIERRGQIGHWECDLAVSKEGRGSLQVAVERRSRYVLIMRLPNQKSLEVRRALNRRMSRLARRLRRSITYDNGHENVEHERVNAVLGTRSYFCDPYASWQKGTVENTIGLIRRHWPKGSDFNLLPGQEVKRMEKRLNNRPGKCLQFRTPQEVFTKASVALQC